MYAYGRGTKNRRQNNNSLTFDITLKCKHATLIHESLNLLMIRYLIHKSVSYALYSLVNLFISSKIYHTFYMHIYYHLLT